MNPLPDSMLEHRIQQRAYEIHQTKANGSQLEDWLEAERQVLQEINYCHDGPRNLKRFRSARIWRFAKSSPGMGLPVHLASI